MLRTYIFYSFVLLILIAAFVAGFGNFKEKRSVSNINSDSEAYELFPDTNPTERSEKDSMKVTQNSNSAVIMGRNDSTTNKQTELKSDKDKMKQIAATFTDIGNINIKMGNLSSYEFNQILNLDSDTFETEISTKSESAKKLAQSCSDEKCINYYWEFVEDFEAQGLLGR